MHRIPRTCEVSAVAPATPEQIWRVLADVTRVGDWSHEARSAQWRRGGPVAEVGARFSGRNHSGVFRWSRECRIIQAEPPQLLAWQTGGALRGLLDSTVWEFELQTVAGGTRIEQRYHLVRAFPPLLLLYAALIKNHRDRTEALREDLVRLGEVAAREPAGAKEA